MDHQLGLFTFLKSAKRTVQLVARAFLKPKDANGRNMCKGVDERQAAHMPSEVRLPMALVPRSL